MSLELVEGCSQLIRKIVRLMLLFLLQLFLAVGELLSKLLER